MIAFNVQDMTCGHCSSTITKAVRDIDPGATVQIDLAGHRVEIDSSSVAATVLCNAIKDAGYTPVVIDGGPDSAAARPSPARSGCYCG